MIMRVGREASIINSWVWHTVNKQEQLSLVSSHSVVSFFSSLSETLPSVSSSSTTMSSCCPDNSHDSQTPYDNYYWHSKGVVEKVKYFRLWRHLPDYLIDRLVTWMSTGQGQETSASSGAMISTASMWVFSDVMMMIMMMMMLGRQNQTVVWSAGWLWISGDSARLLQRRVEGEIVLSRWWPQSVTRVWQLLTWWPGCRLRVTGMEPDKPRSVIRFCHMPGTQYFNNLPYIIFG